MKQPRWKNWLSYLHEFHIESAPSEYNPHLYVSLKHGRYQLSTKNAIYSFGDLYGNFRQAFDHFSWREMPGREVLLLGFGLGSIPFMLEKVFLRSLKYTAVEIDENVVYLAKKYVLDELESPLSFQIADANQFLKVTESKYDLICMDVFIDDNIPEAMQKEDYLYSMKNALTDGGLILFNRLSRTQKDRTDTEAYFKNVFLKVFPDSVHLDVGGNWILSNRKSTFSQEFR